MNYLSRSKWNSFWHFICDKNSNQILSMFHFRPDLRKFITSTVILKYKNKQSKDNCVLWIIKKTSNDFKSFFFYIKLFMDYILTTDITVCFLTPPKKNTTCYPHKKNHYHNKQAACDKWTQILQPNSLTNKLLLDI